MRTGAPTQRLHTPFSRILPFGRLKSLRAAHSRYFKNAAECLAKPNYLTYIRLSNRMVNVEQNATEQNAKRNLDPLLRALQSARASSAAFALSSELRLARHCVALMKSISFNKTIYNNENRKNNTNFLCGFMLLDDNEL
jgi:hypothetical protein